MLFWNNIAGYCHIEIIFIILQGDLKSFVLKVADNDTMAYQYLYWLFQIIFSSIRLNRQMINP